MSHTAVTVRVVESAETSLLVVRSIEVDGRTIPAMARIGRGSIRNASQLRPGRTQEAIVKDEELAHLGWIE